jgi:hypothetical protein
MGFERDLDLAEKMGREVKHFVASAIEPLKAEAVALRAENDALRGRVLELERQPRARDGRDVAMSEVLAMVRETATATLAAWPRPKDGLGISDLDATLEGRNLFLRFTNGERTRQFRVELPIPIYRGVLDPAKVHTLEKHDLCTWAGSMWSVEKDGPTGKPGDGNGDFKLVVKRGSDGVRSADRAPKRDAVVTVPRAATLTPQERERRTDALGRLVERADTP